MGGGYVGGDLEWIVVGVVELVEDLCGDNDVDVDFFVSVFGLSIVCGEFSLVFGGGKGYESVIDCVISDFELG